MVKGHFLSLISPFEEIHPSGNFKGKKTLQQAGCQWKM